jgi:creatinine amidohydrolase/Fe(II)-dependent formamide hydrolase-like protein
MRCRVVVFAISMFACASPAGAQVLRLTDLNTAQLRALDRSKTVVLLTGGMLEEHGPYLPAYTDGILSDRLTQEITQSVIANKPGWTVLLFPQIPLGASGSNEIGGRFSFPGTYAVRPSTLRSIFMDLASELGDQGFVWIMVVHVHGSPLHLRAIDDAGDFFHDTYGGRMINLWDLVPVISGWGNAMASMTDAEKKEDGRSLHAGMDEHSLILYLRPELVAAGYRTAPAVTGESLDSAIAVAQKPEWPGYLGSPRLATAAFGAHIWKAFAAAASTQTLSILGGADPAAITRYVDLLEKNPTYQKGWIEPALASDAAMNARQRAWLKTKGR